MQAALRLRGQSHAWLAGGAGAMHVGRRLQRASPRPRLAARSFKMSRLYSAAGQHG